MKEQSQYNKFASLISDSPSDFLDKAKWLVDNRSWLEISANIACKINSGLKVQGKSRSDLANFLHVTPQYISKVLKGRENLSLKTIDNIQKYLKINLIEVPSLADHKEIVWAKKISILKSNVAVCTHVTTQYKSPNSETRHIKYFQNKSYNNLSRKIKGINNYKKPARSIYSVNEESVFFHCLHSKSSTKQ